MSTDDDFNETMRRRVAYLLFAFSAAGLFAWWAAPPKPLDRTTITLHNPVTATLLNGATVGPVETAWPGAYTHARWPAPHGGWCPGCVSEWSEVLATCSADTLLESLQLAAAKPVADVEVDLGFGPAGAEIVRVTVRGPLGGASLDAFIVPMYPCDGSRVSWRVRDLAKTQREVHLLSLNMRVRR